MAVLPLSEHVKWRGVATSALLNTYAGADREVVVDMQKHTLVLMSGTAGTNYPMTPASRTLTAGAGVKFVVGGTEQTTATLGQDFTVQADLSGIFSTGKGLKVDSTSGKAEVDITLDYAAATGVVSVYGDSAKTNLLGSVTIPSHTSALQSATLQTATAGSPVNGQVSGTYMVFTWLLTNGQTSTMYVDVTSLIDIYTAGNGLQTNSNNDHEFQVKASDGIDVSANGVAVKLKTGEGILVNDSTGLHIDTAALHTEVDQVIVSADANNVVSAGSDGGAYMKLSSNGMLTMNGSNELEVTLDFGTITE